jgi:hypothetical protein
MKRIVHLGLPKAAEVLLGLNDLAERGYVLG